MIPELLIINVFPFSSFIRERKESLIQMVIERRSVFVLKFDLVDDQNEVDDHFIWVVLFLGLRLVVLLHLSGNLLVQLLLVEC